MPSDLEAAAQATAMDVATWFDGRNPACPTRLAADEIERLYILPTIRAEVARALKPFLRDYPKGRWLGHDDDRANLDDCGCSLTCGEVRRARALADEWEADA